MAASKLTTFDRLSPCGRGVPGWQYTYLPDMPEEAKQAVLKVQEDAGGFSVDPQYLTISQQTAPIYGYGFKNQYQQYTRKGYRMFIGDLPYG